MKLASLLLTGLLALGATAAIAADAHDHGAATKTPATTQAAKPVNTVCPVGGEAIDPAVTTTHDGKVIAFCCEHCIATFKKDPEKYMKKLK